MTRITFATAVPDAKSFLPSIFDWVPLGIIQTDAAARPFAFNRYAARILKARDGLDLTARGLKAGRSGCNRRLHEAMRRATGRQPARTATLVLVRPSGRRPLVVAVVSAATSDVHRHWGCTTGLFITDPEAPPLCDQEVLRRWFGLTPAEARLAAGLVAGLRIEMAARGLGITPGTARVHVKRVLEKTGTARQAEFVALLARSPAMLGRPLSRQVSRKMPIDAALDVHSWWLLDYLPFAMIVANPDGRVRSVNEHGRRLLCFGRGIGLDGRRLHGVADASTAVLRQAIARASDPTCPRASALLLTRRDRRPLHLVIIPHPGGLDATGPPDGALLVIDDPGMRPPFDLEVLARLFQLTPTEARLAAELAIGTSLKAAAGTLAISIDTARTHLKRVFAKTDTGRQVELVGLLAANAAVLAMPSEDGSTDNPGAAARTPNGGRRLGEVWLTSP